MGVLKYKDPVTGKVMMVGAPKDPGYTDEQILADATKTMFGLDASAVPNDAFAFLGKYNQHWWAKHPTETNYILEQSTTETTLRYNSEGYDVDGEYMLATISYSSEVEVAPSGLPALVNPQTITVWFSGFGINYANVLFGKYVDCGGLIYKLSESATAKPGPQAYFTLSPAYAVKSVEVASNALFATSADRNAYPDSGEVDGYEYEYLGVPLVNALNPGKVESGSYVGTGVCGKDFPNTLTFDFTPQLVFFYDEVNSYFLSVQGEFTGVVIWAPTKTLYYKGSSNSEVIGHMDISGNTLTWYIISTASTNAKFQMNESGKTYHYLAIG